VIKNGIQIWGREEKRPGIDELIPGGSIIFHLQAAADE
jgi:hypothetical protein